MLILSTFPTLCTDFVSFFFFLFFLSRQNIDGITLIAVAYIIHHIISYIFLSAPARRRNKMKVMKDYIKMPSSFLLYRFITTKFNFLGCIHNTLTEFSIFQTCFKSFPRPTLSMSRCSIFLCILLFSRWSPFVYEKKKHIHTHIHVHILKCCEKTCFYGQQKQQQQREKGKNSKKPSTHTT